MTAECANISRRCKLSSFRICQCPLCRMLWWLYFEQKGQSGRCYGLDNGDQARYQHRRLVYPKNYNARKQGQICF